VSTEERVPGAGDRARPSELVGSFLSTFAIFAAIISIAWHPLRLVLVSALLALIGAAMAGERPQRQRLAYTAVLVCAASFFFGMVVAVVFKKPLW
jgi:hypothetical protein